jgi:hypothetical protein
MATEIFCFEFAHSIHFSETLRNEVNLASMRVTLHPFPSCILRIKICYYLPHTCMEQRSRWWQLRNIVDFDTMILLCSWFTRRSYPVSSFAMGQSATEARHCSSTVNVSMWTAPQDPASCVRDQRRDGHCHIVHSGRITIIYSGEHVYLFLINGGQRCVYFH